jgi:hypothetical protein
LFIGECRRMMTLIGNDHSVNFNDSVIFKLYINKLRIGECFYRLPGPSNSYKTILPTSFMMFMVMHIKYNSNHRPYDGEKVIAVKNENPFQNTPL